MPYVTKVDENWFPSENTNLQVGEEVFIDNIDQLVKEGKVSVSGKKVVVDEPVERVTEVVASVEGAEFEDKEDDSLVCEVCGKEAKSLAGLKAHLRSHE